MKPKSIERQAQANLIRIAHAWCDATGNTISAAGRQVVKDSRFFTNMIERYEAGERQDTKGSVTFRIYDRVVAWFSDMANWPEGMVHNIPHLEDLIHTKEEHAPEKTKSTSDLLAKLRNKAS